jgi:3-oxoacyl-[acyl-carrier-protein] synthase II
VNPRPSRVGVVVTGLDVLSACGRGPEALGAAVFSGAAAFAPVTRFDTAKRTVRDAAQLPGAPDLGDELLRVIGAALRAADVPGGAAEQTPVLLALHADARTRRLATHVGCVYEVENVYTCACVAASTAVADAATRISLGRSERIAVAAGYLVEPDTFAVFDAGRALARDGRARPFSPGRGGLLLGDAVAAIVLEAEPAARDRNAPVLARIPGWARTGDAYHVCRPAPDGSGLGRAIGGALERAGLRPEQLGYVNANATGAPLADSAETAALRGVLGAQLGSVPISSTKSVHGHALEASALLELIVAILAVRAGRLPVNAGYLGAEEFAAESAEHSTELPLDLVLDPGRTPASPYALSLNSAFGGANTALLVEAV